MGRKDPNDETGIFQDGDAQRPDDTGARERKRRRDLSPRHHVRPKCRRGDPDPVGDRVLLPGDLGTYYPETRHCSWHIAHPHWTLPETRIVFVCRSRPDRTLAETYENPAVRQALAHLYGEGATASDAQRWVVRVYDTGFPRNARERKAQLAGRDVEELLCGIRRTIRRIQRARIAPKLKTDAERNALLLSNTWRRLFRGWDIIEVFFVLELWKRPDGTLNADFLDRKMRAAWRKRFGRFAEPDDAKRYLLERFGSEFVEEQLREMLAGRTVKAFLEELRDFAFSERGLS